MSECGLDERNEDIFVWSLPGTSAGRIEKQRAMAEQGTKGFTLLPPLEQVRNTPSRKSAPPQYMAEQITLFTGTVIIAR